MPGSRFHPRNLYAKFKQHVPNPFYRRILIGLLGVAAIGEGSVYWVMFQRWRRGEDLSGKIVYDPKKWAEEDAKKLEDAK
ncbi:hypothetical protein HDV00_009177 [Rhizophlyctis rosea]|nr:hypothetical protein HDV00_009177 [Rhizophlyctis rosea]